MYGVTSPLSAEAGRASGPCQPRAAGLIARHPDLWALALIVAVALALRLGFFLNAPPFFEGDARGYLVRAVEIPSGPKLNFSSKATGGYPLFIAAVFAVGEPSLQAIVFAQHLLGVGSSLAAYLAARTLAGRLAGLLAGLATAASGSALIYEHVILTEALFGCLLAAGTALLLIGLRRRSLRWYVAAGATMGIATLVRPVALALLPLAMAPILLRPQWRRALLAGASYALSFGLVLLVWSLGVVRNSSENTPVHPGQTLVERTLRHSGADVSMYADPGSPTDPPLIRAGRRVLRDIEPEQPSAFEVRAALARRLNLSDAEASRLAWQVAVDAVRRHPDLYLAGTWDQLVKLIIGDDESVARHVGRRSAWKGKDLERVSEEGMLPPSLSEPELPPDEALGLAELMGHLYQPSGWMVAILAGCGLALYWAVRDTSRRPVLLPLSAAAILAVCTVAMTGSLPRYRYPLDPLLHVAAAAGIVWTIGALLERRVPGRGLLARPSRPRAGARASRPPR